MPISQFYHNRKKPPKGRVHVKALGLHETMRPSVIRHGGGGYPFLFMHFHNKAYLDCESPTPQPSDHGFIVWPPGMLHDYGNLLCEWDHSWLIASGDAIVHAATTHRLPLGKLLFFESEEPFVRYLSAINSELQRKARQDSFILERILCLMIYELSRSYDEGKPRIPTNILAAEEFMRQNFEKSISLRQIAATASLSVSRFLFLFRRFYGESPIHFLIRTRLERAAQLLAYENLSIKEIAQESGFMDQLYFSRQFKKAFGKSPREFRGEL